jgi:hypothetical protein
MSVPTTPARQIERYLERLRSSLRALPAGQVDDIAREIRSHLLESAGAEAGLAEQQVAAAIARLGEPEALAAAYVLDDLAVRAQTSASPILLLRVAGSWARRSLRGVRDLFVAIVGYATAFIGLGCALFKPFIPERVGLWVQHVPPDDVAYQLGRVSSPPADARELLGWYIIPLGLLVGGLAFVATTRYLRARVRKYRAASRPPMDPDSRGNR